MNIENLMQIVLRNSEDATRAIEQTKVAIQQSNEIHKTVTETLQKVASTNEKQTAAITTFISDKEKLERAKDDIDLKYQKQIDAIVLQAATERKQLIFYIKVMAVILFIAIGGSTILSKLQELGLFKVITGV